MIDNLIQDGNSIKLVSPEKDYRILDAWGDVKKYSLEAGFPTDDTTGDPSGWDSTVVEVGTQVRYIREKDHVEILGGKYDGLWIEPKYLDVIGEPPPDDDPPPDGETVTWPSKTMQLRNTVTGEVYQNEDPVILTRSNG